jgi:hypothetical protein
MSKLTKDGLPRKSNAGRKSIYTDDVGVLLTIQVPSRQKENIKQMILALRKQFEKK